MSEKQLKTFDRVLYFCLGVTVVIAIVAGALWINNRVNAMVQEVTPEQCQYPTRPLVNGQCDNSDPCDPTRIKIDGGKCVDEPKPDLNEFKSVDKSEPTPVVTECGK